MRLQALLKAVAVSCSAVLAVLVTGLSVSQEQGGASTQGTAIVPAMEERRPAPSAEETVTRIVQAVEARKKARMAVLRFAEPPTVSAQVTQPAVREAAPAPLLPVVNQDSISAHHQKLSDAVLRALPPPCRTYLQNYYVRYDKPERRGLGGQTTIILDGTVSDEEFVGLLIHECAHVTHGNMQGTPETGASPFRDNNNVFYNDSPMVAFFAISWETENVKKTGSAEEGFASGYGQSDAFEDFAECFALYILHRDAFEERAQESAAMAQKLQWMKTFLYSEEGLFGQSSYVWNNEVPWDVTRLPLKLSF